MKEITVNGTIVASEDQTMYEWFGIECTSPKMVINGLKEANGDQVRLLVNSGGGDLMAGNEIYSALKRYSGEVTAEITAFAGSAATVICCGADTVKANPGIQYMIHNVSTVQMGDKRDMETMAEVLNNADISIANIYRLKTGLPEKEIIKMMSHGTGNMGTWMDAKRAKELGFVDEIIGDDGSLVAQPISIYNSLFATVLSDETKARFREMQLAEREAETGKHKLEARLALLKIKGGKNHV